MPIINSLKLKNFGIHRNRTFTFADGFNVIRGANEAGKTTILEAIAIAFFGNLALRGGWVDVVTYGEKEATLSIDMTFGQYKIRRTKSSASVVSDDGQVEISGHNDVTDFFVRMFGIDKAAVKHVMIAEQGAIQGILSSGATDATKFIENLAGFDQIDQLVELMKVKFPVVDGQALKQQESSLEIKLTEKQAEELPDLAATKATVTQKETIRSIRLNKTSAAEKLIGQLTEELDELKEQKRGFDFSTAQAQAQQIVIDDLKTTQLKITGQVKALEVEIDCSAGRLKSAQAFLDQLAQKQSDYNNYNKVQEFEYCEETWDESFEALKEALEVEKIKLVAVEDHIKANEKKVIQLESSSPESEQLTLLTARRDDLSKQQAVLKAMTGDSAEVTRIKALLAENEQAAAVERSKFIKETTCPTCGTDLEEKAAQVNGTVQDKLVLLNDVKLALEIDLKSAYQAQRDARTQQEKDLNNEYTKTIKKLEVVIDALSVAQLAEIKKIEAFTSELQLQLPEAKATIQSMEGIIDCQNRLEVLLDQIDERKISINQSLYPWTLTWISDIPTKPDQGQITKANNDVVYCQGLVTQLQGRNEEFHKCCKDISAAEVTLVKTKQILRMLVDPSEKINELMLSISTKKEELTQLRQDLEAAVLELNTATTRLALDEQAVKKHGEDIVEIKKDIKKVQDEILKSADNNALHRAVADARGVVIEGVWNTLLAAANGCFSAIRGVESNITRDGKFFRVDGVKTIRLSGSTLDSLGLAMRAAVRDVFCPACNFVLLDEIAAGMDSERTAAAMGQIACLNVPQVILVTHEGISDTLANHIIEV